MYYNEKENWRILISKEIYAVVKKPTVTETVRLNILCWFGYGQRMEENRIPQKVLYMNLEMRLRGRQRNKWQNELKEDGRLVSVQEWRERVYSREEWKKLLRMARNHLMLHMPMEWMNEWMNRLTIGFWCQVSLTHVDVDCFNIVCTVHHVSYQFYLSAVNAHSLWANHFLTTTPTCHGACLWYLQGVLDTLKWHSHLLILR